MVLIPARCGTCGHTWQPPGFNIEGSSVSMAGNTTACERCGATAYFISGAMNVAGDAIELLSGPQWSADVISHLRLGLAQIIEQKPDAVAEAVRQIDLNDDRVRRLADRIEAMESRGRSKTELLNIVWLRLSP